MVFLCFKMNAKENAKEVKDSWYDSRFNDFHVRNTNEFSHQECSCAHDRRHQLAACGSGSFYGACKVLMVTQFLHHRNGEGARTYNVCNGRSGNGALESRGKYGNFCRTTGCPACNGVRNINEEFAKACLFQECTKEDKQENKC